jgi:hypothetical protein
MRAVKFMSAIMLIASFISLDAVAVRAESATTPAALEGEQLVALTILSSSERRDITVSEIEALGLRQVTTRSPWEAGELKFEGVLLRDVLRLAGMENAEAVTVRAEDGYRQTIPREDWEKWPLILATRQDGQALTKRTQGPTRIVYPLNDYPELDTPDYKPRWIWTITSIEATNQSD